MVASSLPVPGAKLHVVYLLHGNGGSYRDWQSNAPLAPYAARGYIFVMPEGHGSYWVNSASIPNDRYEDYLTTDLIDQAERGLPSNRDRSIAGVSMGGFGALVLALRHPRLYVSAGALSPSVDVPRRHFTFWRLSQSMAIRRIFGRDGSTPREQLDPFWLVRNQAPACVPYLYVGSGAEPLAEPIARFAALLDRTHIPHIYRTEPGGHGWTQWNLHLGPMLTAMGRPASSCAPATK